MGIRAIPMPVQGDSHSRLSHQFPFPRDSHGIPMIISTFESTLNSTIVSYRAALVQQTISYVVRHVCKDRILNFIDLCSTANVSVFALTSQHCGLYVHGQCVHGASDVNMRTWYHNMCAEEARLTLTV